MILGQSMKLEAVLAGAVSANQPEVHVDYLDYNAQGVPTIPAISRVALNGNTDVTILAAPPTTNPVREVLRIGIYNKDTASATVTVKTDDGTERIQIKTTLLTLESLHWEKGRGWYALDANGNSKEVTSSIFSGITADTISGNVVATQANMETGTATNLVVSPGRMQYFPGVVKAFAYVTISGGTPSIQRSFNVSSITDNGVGTFAVNFTTAFSAGDYSFLQGSTQNGGGGVFSLVIENADSVVRSTTAHNIYTVNNTTTLVDVAKFSVAYLGDQ